MKIIKNRLHILVVLLTVLCAVSCETTELDLTTNPSRLTPESADAEALLNNAQLNFVFALAHNEDNEDGLNVRAAEFVRMQHLFGSYTGGFALTSTGINNNLWVPFYRETLKDIETMFPIAEAGGFTGHTGVGKILKAYTYVLLVDTFGDVPYTEALLGNENQNPKTDGGQDIYNAMLTIIDEGIAAIDGTDSAIMPSDLFYDGDKAKWMALGRTLKLKMYVQMRLLGDFSTEINAILTAGVINDGAGDFEFKYSNVQAPNDSRHPYYILNYDAGGPDDYLTSYYVNLLKDRDGTGQVDPRLRYYFYRQTSFAPTGDFLVCSDLPLPNNCYLGSGYWTRLHGDPAGVQPDQRSRSTYGLYPIGGAFDANNFRDTRRVRGAEGAGIFPIMLSSYSKFLQAESALMSGTAGDPKALMIEGIEQSIEKVRYFNTDEVTDGDNFAMTNTDVTDYVAFATGLYDAATTDEQRLDIIMKEYYIALWGNGYEAWNNYRRTSMPSDLPAHHDTPGIFPRTFMYPASVVNSNSSISQKQVSEKTFWDVNPDNLD